MTTYTSIALVVRWDLAGNLYEVRVGGKKIADVRVEPSKSLAPHSDFLYEGKCVGHNIDQAISTILKEQGYVREQ